MRKFKEGNLKQMQILWGQYKNHTRDVIVHTLLQISSNTTCNHLDMDGIYGGFKLLFHPLGTQLQICGYTPTWTLIPSGHKFKSYSLNSVPPHVLPSIRTWSGRSVNKRSISKSQICMTACPCTILAHFATNGRLFQKADKVWRSTG
jgi:hypothetical protein